MQAHLHIKSVAIRSVFTVLNIEQNALGPQGLSANRCFFFFDWTFCFCDPDAAADELRAILGKVASYLLSGTENGDLVAFMLREMADLTGAVCPGVGRAGGHLPWSMGL